MKDFFKAYLIKLSFKIELFKTISFLVFFLFLQNRLLYIIQLIKASGERKSFDGIEEKMAPPNHPCPGLLVINWDSRAPATERKPYRAAEMQENNLSESWGLHMMDFLTAEMHIPAIENVTFSLQKSQSSLEVGCQPEGRTF